MHPSRAEEEKVRMDGELLLTMDDASLYWPSSDMQQEEYKELADGHAHFTTFPSLPSPHAAPPLSSSSSSFLATYGQPDWSSQHQEDVGAGSYFGAPLTMSSLSSAWANPPVSHWQHPPFITGTASTHIVDFVPSPLLTSPVHSPQHWHTM